VIDICVKNHIGSCWFVGGEPLVHKDLGAMTRYAVKRGIRPMICTNGSLWTERNMRELAADALASVIMSIDAHDVVRHEKNRVFRTYVIRSSAPMKSLLSLGFKRRPALRRASWSTIAIDCRTFSRASDLRTARSVILNHAGFELSQLQQFQPGQVHDGRADRVFERIKRMKQRSGFPVVNPMSR